MQNVEIRQHILTWTVAWHFQSNWPKTELHGVHASLLYLHLATAGQGCKASKQVCSVDVLTWTVALAVKLVLMVLVAVQIKLSVAPSGNTDWPAVLVGLMTRIWRVVETVTPATERSMSGEVHW